LLNRLSQADCTPGYYNNEGQTGTGKGLADQTYGGGPVEFFALVRSWREDGQMRGLSMA